MEETRSDPELWKLFRQGDHQAFSGIYHRYINLLYRYGGRITGDYAIVEDAIQDMFVDLWKSRSNLSEPDSVKYYLFRVLRRKIARNLSEKLTTQEVNDDKIDSLLRTESAEHEQVTGEQAGHQIRMLQAALSNLSARQQEAINLRYFHDFTFDQISGIMGISSQSAQNMLQIAMKKLRKVLVSTDFLTFIIILGEMLFEVYNLL